MSSLEEMKVAGEFGCTDCHSHAYGPYELFPLAKSRTFDPPESPIESLEEVWKVHHIDRAVLIQGSAYGTDHAALLNAIARDPEHRRGVAILQAGISDSELIKLHQSGIRGVRFNWVKHLLGKIAWNRTDVLAEAAALLKRVDPLGWHGELHIDAELLELAEDLALPKGMPLVIDHMARLDASLGADQPSLARLLRLQKREYIWVKLSGADRLAKRSASLQSVVPIVRNFLQQAPERCVWGLDWPHVNLELKRTDAELIGLLDQIAEDKGECRRVLIENPARLYDFPSTDVHPDATMTQREGAIIA
jgi:2-pyrone-4,6-dicarboxylate lactonase